MPGRARLLAPGAVAIGPGGRVFTADLLRYGIVALGPDGRSLGVLGGHGAGDGGFQIPTGVAVDGRGRVFATDAINADVQEFVPAHGGYRFARRFADWKAGNRTRSRVAPPALVVYSATGRVYVGDAHWGIVSFSESGRHLHAWSPGDRYVVHGLSIGPDGDVYATFAARYGVPGAQQSYRLSPSLASRRSLGFADPAGAPYLAVDGAGDFYASSQAPGRDGHEVRAGGRGLSGALVLPHPGRVPVRPRARRAHRVFVPSFANSPKPRGWISVYAPVDPPARASRYRRTAALRGG